MRHAEWVLDCFVALYPALMAAVWIAGGIVFRRFEERGTPQARATWPGVTLVVPAHNERATIGRCVRAALDVGYPTLEVLVMDDGSTDGTAEAAREAAGGDPRVTVARDPQNRGKSAQLNDGFARARHALVAVTDADTHLTPGALHALVDRIEQSPRNAAVAGSPHVTNRGSLLSAMQMIEAASIIGLIRRTQALAGTVAVVAGVLGLFRRDAVLEVGGFDGRMATEDIDLSWKLLLAGWHTTFDPRATVGMEVPTDVRTLWRQRQRWARGQGEVLRMHLRRALPFSRRRLWLVALEACASLLWAIAFLVSTVLFAVRLFAPDGRQAVSLGIVWAVTIGAIATVQALFAVGLTMRYDPIAWLVLFLSPLVTIGFWIVNVAAAVLAEVPGLVRGPSKDGVVWDLGGEQPVGFPPPTGR
jgi:poly-beta-1,6-N-acetyl-D-glucosamine synthase